MARPTRHHTWVHQEFKYTDPRAKGVIVECVLCGMIARNIPRRDEAKKIGLQHEQEANHE